MSTVRLFEHINFLWLKLLSAAAQQSQPQTIFHQVFWLWFHAVPHCPGTISGSGSGRLSARSRQESRRRSSRSSNSMSSSSLRFDSEREGRELPSRKIQTACPLLTLLLHHPLPQCQLIELTSPHYITLRHLTVLRPTITIKTRFTIWYWCYNITDK